MSNIFDISDAFWSSEGYIAQFPNGMRILQKTGYTVIIICREGSFNFDVNGYEGRCEYGNMLVVSRKASLQIKGYSDDLQVRIFCMRIDNMYDHISNAAFTLALHLKLNSKFYSIFQGSEITNIDKYIDLIDQNKHISGCENMLYLMYEKKLLLLALAHRLCHLYQQQLDIEKVNFGVKNELCLRFMKLVEENYEKERNLAFYADKLCVTSKYLSSVVKSVCGIAVHEIISEYVVSRMCYYLVNTTKPILEISEEMNFLSPSHFGIYFRRHKGMSPSDFRRKYSK